MASLSRARLWVAGARPRTLPAALVPVAVGASCAAGEPGVAWWRVGLAAVVSLTLQVGVNYANDYSDGVRGTDADRVGPLRLVGSGLVEPARVKRAAMASLLVACCAGLVLALLTTLWLVVVGLAAVLAAWFYTGGPRPYGYAGLGEVFVFVFFGLVATVGTTYVLSDTTPAASWWAGSAAGCLSCALLVVNNLRDIPGDTESGKRTLAVRLGDRRTRSLFVVQFVAAALCVVVTATVTGAWALLGLAGVVAAAPAVRSVLGGATGPALVAVLGGVGRAQLVFGGTSALGIALALAG
ncbi:MAG: 1,4-dihydroxy-2-naphthoate polyprenyltransferase [Ilumatobacteraceae bacterium]